MSDSVKKIEIFDGENWIIPFSMPITLIGDVTGQGDTGQPIQTTFTKTLDQIANAGDINVLGHKLLNVATPESNGDGTNKAFVDSHTWLSSSITDLNTTIASYNFATQSYVDSHTWLPSAITGFDTQVRTSRLDQMVAPTASLNLNSQKIINLLTPSASTDGATKGYVDSSISAIPTGTVTLTGAVTGSGNINSTITTSLSDTITKINSQVFSFPGAGAINILATGYQGYANAGLVFSTNLSSNTFQLLSSFSNNQTSSPDRFSLTFFNSTNAVPIFSFATGTYQASFSVPLSMSSQGIYNLANPINNFDATHKYYVDTHTWTSSQITDLSTTIANKSFSLIGVVTGSGTLGSPLSTSFASNPVFPGTASMTLPIGTTAQRPSTAVFGMMRANSNLTAVEMYTGASWVSLNTSNATVSSIGITAGTGLSVSGSPVTSSGNITVGLSNTAVTAGTYTYISALTTNAQGQITGISSGSAPTGGTVTSVACTGSTGLTVSGSPITSSGTLGLTLGSELQALSGLNTLGLVCRTATNTYVPRNIAVGTGLSITNPAGTAGNPTLSISTIPIANLSGYPGTTTTFLRGDGTWILPYVNNLNINGTLSLSSYGLTTSGNVSATTGTLIANNLQAYNSGSLAVQSPLAMGSNGITGLANPVNAQDAMTLNYANATYLQQTTTSSATTYFINVNSTNTANTGIAYQCLLNGNQAAGFGYNASTNELYIRAYTPTTGNPATIRFTTNGNKQLVIGTDGSANFQGNTVTGLASPVNATDAVNMTYVDTKNLNSFPVTSVGLGLGGYNIYNLADPTVSQHAATKNYVDNLTSWFNLTSGAGVAVLLYRSLSISNAGLPRVGPYGYLNSSGSTGTAGSSTVTYNYSICASGRIQATEFNAYSSEKKKIVLRSGKDIEEDVIDKFRMIPLHEYTYKDKIAEGHAVCYGVTAESLQKVLSEYVDENSQEFVPNIYSEASVSQSKGLYKINLKSIPVLESQRLRIIIEDQEVEKELEVEIVKETATALFVKSKEKLPSRVFVYGTYESCPSVSKMKLFEMNLVVTQNILRRLENIEKGVHYA